jgi:hypothetical protein
VAATTVAAVETVAPPGCTDGTVELIGVTATSARFPNTCCEPLVAVTAPLLPEATGVAGDKATGADAEDTDAADAGPAAGAAPAIDEVGAATGIVAGVAAAVVAVGAAADPAARAITTGCWTVAAPTLDGAAGKACVTGAAGPVGDAAGILGVTGDVPETVAPAAGSAGAAAGWVRAGAASLARAATGATALGSEETTEAEEGIAVLPGIAEAPLAERLPRLTVALPFVAGGAFTAAPGNDARG